MRKSIRQAEMFCGSIAPTGIMGENQQNDDWQDQAW